MKQLSPGKNALLNCHILNDVFTVCRKVWINYADLPYLLLREIFDLKVILTTSKLGKICRF